MKTRNLEGEILENALNALNNVTGVDYLIEETELIINSREMSPYKKKLLLSLAKVLED